MADLGELAAVLAASGNNSSQARTLVNAINPQPNSMETGLALEATRNPFAMPYYQAARLERTGNRMSPGAMDALKAAQMRDYELQRLEALAGPLATIVGHTPAATQGVMQTLGVPLNDDLFALEQLLATRSANADAVQSVGSGVQNAASGGGDFNDVLTQLGFDPLDRVTPTSVQSAAAGKTDKNDGPTVRYDSYDNGFNISLTDVPPGTSIDEARRMMGLDNAPAAGSGITVGNGNDNAPPVTVPPEVTARVNRSVATQGYTPTSDITFNGYDNRGEPVFIQRVTRGGRDDIVVTSRNSAGQWVTTLQSRTVQTQ